VENALLARGVRLHGAVITVLGAAYLENSDDTRNTPAAPLIASLQAKGATVRLHDPHVREWDFDSLEIERDIAKAADGSDCLVLVTRHKEYYSLDFDKLKNTMRTPTLVDGRNVFDREKVESKGFEYRCVGKSGPKHIK
jgi:UDP-N-acetyl-D-mannosaminuronic acid dehydrogenase